MKQFLYRLDADSKKLITILVRNKDQLQKYNSKLEQLRKQMESRKFGYENESHQQLIALGESLEDELDDIEKHVKRIINLLYNGNY